MQIIEGVRCRSGEPRIVQYRKAGKHGMTSIFGRVKWEANTYGYIHALINTWISHIPFQRLKSLMNCLILKFLVLRLILPVLCTTKDLPAAHIDPRLVGTWTSKSGEP